jgi:hypothetical protein
MRRSERPVPIGSFYCTLMKLVVILFLGTLLGESIRKQKEKECASFNRTI